MIFDSINTSSLNSEIIQGILLLIPQAEAALKENNLPLFIDRAYIIETCASQTYLSLQQEIKNHIFNISWDMGKLKDSKKEDLIPLAEIWAKSMIDSCKQHLI